VLGSSLADLRPMRGVVPHYRFLGIVSPEIKDHTLRLESWVYCLILLVARSHLVD
jgi:hypothetical protein